jgi:hypothetical protein
MKLKNNIIWYVKQFVCIEKKQLQFYLPIFAEVLIYTMVFQRFLDMWPHSLFFIASQAAWL